ncbi:hypothetical protein ACFE04_010668 [Oxalis oulophora]
MQGGRNQTTRVCDVCGVVGFRRCLVPCIRCTIARHTYCMRVYGEQIPENWICEDCQKEKEDLNPSDEDHSKGNGNNNISKMKESLSLEQGIKLESAVPRKVARRN